MPRTRSGFTTEEWDEMRAETQRVLAEVGAHRGTITYGELALRVSGGRMSARSATLMELLDDACREHDREHGSVMATVVVRADSGRPGEGYFVHMERAGYDVNDREALWRQEAQRVWDGWADSADIARQEEVGT